MNLLHVAEGVEYSLLHEADVPDMATLLAEAFSRFEPMAVAAKLPASQVAHMVAALAPKALAEQLTIVARLSAPESSRGPLVGVLLADDFGTAPPPGIEDVAPMFAPIGALLDGLDAQYRSATAVVPGTHAHLFMLGVAEHAGSRGIAGHLVASCLAQAQRRGYLMAVTEATGAVSHHVFRKVGFQHVATASYCDFSHEGQLVFSAITGVEGTMLMTRDLGGAVP